MKNSTRIIYMWVLAQSVLLILPIVCFLLYTPYTISKDQHYVNTINYRATGTEQEGIANAVVLYMDAKKQYEHRVWKLQNKELYYIEGIMIGLVIGLLLQIFNIFWAEGYRDAEYDDHDNGW